MSQATKHILLTRALIDAEPEKQRLQQKGYAVSLAPVMEIRFLDDAAKRIKEVLVEPIYAFIITSANSVRALAKATDDRHFRLITVGLASTEEAEALGFKDILNAAPDGQGNGEKLVQFIQEHVPTDVGRLVHLSGQVMAGNVSQQLKMLGYHAERVVVYEAASTPEMSQDVQTALVNHTIDAISFYSARSAKLFIEQLVHVELLDRVQDVDVLCLSPQVALPLEKQGFSKIHIAPNAKSTSMQSLLEETCPI